MPVQQNEVPECVSNYMASIGSIGGKRGTKADKIKAGKKRSKAKAMAARQNGLLGGRPATDADDKLALKK